jgi:hypothetical protein
LLLPQLPQPPMIRKHEIPRGYEETAVTSIQAAC